MPYSMKMVIGYFNFSTIQAASRFELWWAGGLLYILMGLDPYKIKISQWLQFIWSLDIQAQEL